MRYGTPGRVKLFRDRPHAVGGGAIRHTAAASALGAVTGAIRRGAAGIGALRELGVETRESRCRDEYGCDVGLEHVKKLLERDCFGRVRHLGLANTNLADRIAELLQKTKILAQLESLDFSRGTFGNEGARALLEAAGAYRHLRQIDLAHHYVGDELAAAFQQIGPKVVLDDAQAPDVDGVDEYRYVQISE